MGDVEIKGRITVDRGNMTETVSSAKKEIKGLGDELKKVGGTGTFDKLKDSLKGAGPAAMEAAKGTGIFNAALNVLKANPIVLVVTTLAGLLIGLFSHFKKMEGVSDSLGKAWGTLSGIFTKFITGILTPLIDGFAKLVELFTDGVVYVMDKLGMTSEETAKRLGNITEALDDLEDAERNSALAIAESNMKLQEAREKAADANIPIRERIEALREAGRIEKQELDNIVRINTEKAKLLLEQMAIEIGMRDSLISKIREGSMETLKAAREELMMQKNIDKEKLTQIDQMIIAAEKAAKDRAKISRKEQIEVTSLEREEQAKRKAQHEAYLRSKHEKELKMEQAKLDKLAEMEEAHSRRQKQMAADMEYQHKDEEKKKYDISTGTIQAIADKQIGAIAEAAEQQVNSAKIVAAWEQMTADQRKESIMNVARATQALGQIVGEQTVAGKAFAIATATINTFLGATEALRQKSTLPSPFDVIAKIANVSAVIASGLSAVKNIARVNVPGRGASGGGGAPSTLAVAAPLTPAVSSTSFNASSIQAVGNAAAKNVRAFVLESDVANNRERIERLNRAARI